MSYIERETALQIIDNYAKTVLEDGKVVVDAIRDIVGVITPTADVVEVVRCKDCKYSSLEWIGGDLEGICKCGSATINITPNSYCSYGERRAENEG